MPTIYFRTDGNEKIATGHIMRCLSIARACTALQITCHFLVADETSLAILQERFAHPDEFSASCLHSNYQDMESELPVLLPMIKDCSWLFIDSYFVTPSYLSELRKYCRTAYLDDMLAFDYPVDLVINYDIDTENVPSCYRHVPQKLIGASYTPLREQFQIASCQIRPDVHNIFLSTGGTDACNAAGKILNRIFLTSHENDTPFSDAVLQNCHYHIVTSRLNSHYPELLRLAAAYPVIHIYENVRVMASLMSECDLALSAGGTTLYELCAVGVPSISFATADNQLNAAETFAKKYIVPYAGDIRFSPDDVLENITAFLYEHIHSYEKRQEKAQRMRSFIDGNGSARVACALAKSL